MRTFTAALLLTLAGALLFKIAQLRHPLYDEAAETMVAAANEMDSGNRFLQDRVKLPVTPLQNIPNLELGNFHTPGKTGWMMRDFLLRIVLRTFGVGVLQARLSSIFAGLLALVIFMLIAKILFEGNWFFVLASAAWLAFSPLFLGFASLCRPNIFLVLTFLFSFLVYLKAKETSALKYYLLLGIASGLTLTAHPHGLFFIAALFLALCVDRPRSSSSIKHIALWAAGIFLVILVSFPFFDFDWFLLVTKFHDQSPKAEGFFILQENFRHAAGKLFHKIIERPSTGWWHSTIGLDSVIAHELYALGAAFVLALVSFKKLTPNARRVVWFTGLSYLLFELGESSGRGEYLLYFLPFLILVLFELIRDSLGCFSIAAATKIILLIYMLLISYQSRRVIYHHLYTALIAQPSFPDVVDEIRKTIPQGARVAGQQGMWLYMSDYALVDFHPYPNSQPPKKFSWPKNLAADYVVYDQTMGSPIEYAKTLPCLELIKTIPTPPELDMGTVYIFKIK